jgi:hypothetical protein
MVCLCLFHNYIIIVAAYFLNTLHVSVVINEMFV